MTGEETANTHAELAIRIKGMECGSCHNPFLTVAYRNREYTIYCPKCSTEWPPLERMKSVTDLARAAEGERMSTQLEEYRRTGLPTAMTVGELRRLLPATKATDQEVEAFMVYCRAAQLNPFLKEVYLVKYQESEPASIILGIETHMKRAGHNPAFRGLASGVIVLRKGEEIRIEGKVLRPGDELLGGWATVHHANRTSYTATASLAEYDTGMFLWKKKRATMIETTAIRHALKRYFPDDVGDLEDSELSVEMVDSFDALPSGEQVDTATGEIVKAPVAHEEPPEQGIPIIGNVGQFLTWATETYGYKNSTAICADMGVEKPVQILQLHKTWDEAVAYLTTKHAPQDASKARTANVETEADAEDGAY